MEEEYRNIWELYGLRTNPFFTGPLILFGGEMDLQLGFVGREEEVRRLQSVINGHGGSRILVSGDVGVGKTTFVNYVRATASQKKFFTPLKEIAVQPEWTGADFILNTLSSIYYTLKRRTDIDEKLLSSEIIKKLELLVDIVERKDKEVSLSIAGFGAGVGSNTSLNIPNLTIHSIQIFFEQIIEEIKLLGYKELILHYNNLEIIEPTKLQKLFQSIRDFIQTKDVNFIFIGDLTVPQTINQIKRVASIMSESPIILENLTVTQIKQLLDTRIKYLAAPSLTTTKPYEDEVISKLYSLYDGNIRFILNSLSTVFKELIRETPIIIGKKELISVLSEAGRKRWLNKLTDWEQEVLFYILREEETNNKRIAEHFKKQKQNISKVTNKLLDLCAIKIKKIDGKEKFFSVEHSIKWFLLKENKKDKNIIKGDFSKEIQEVLTV
ncbi:MAG: ATP-binding protein [Candidatus Parcubacteria bacterium]|nr:ATP-binding protein [Candidatus Parcubacteria bacterium]